MLPGAKVAAIEFAGDEVRAAVISTGVGLPNVLETHAATAVYENPEDRDAALAAALDRVLGAFEARPGAHVLVASAQYSVARNLTIPFRGARKVSAAVSFELEPFLAFPIEDLLVDHNTLMEIDGETEVLAMGLRRDRVEAQLALLAGADIEAEAVAMDVVALTGLWARIAGKPKGLAAVLHLRHDGALLAVAHNGALAFYRHLRRPADRAFDGPAAYAIEVQTTLRAFQSKWRGGGEIAALHVTGADLAPHERAALSEAAGLPVESIVMVSRLKGGSGVLADGPGGARDNTFEACIGAALGAAGGCPGNDFSPEAGGAAGLLRPLIPHLMFSSCLALLLLLGLAFHHYQAANRLEADAARLRQEIDAINTEILAMADQGLGEDINTAPYADPPLVDLIGEIGRLMPDSKVNIEDIRIAPPGALGAWITIQGRAMDATQLTEVLNSLAQSLLVAVDGEPEKRVQDGIIRFTLKLRRAAPQEAADATA